MRGTTLIEVMIAIAVLGIGTAGVGALVNQVSKEASDVVLWERAGQVLESEADAISRGIPLAPEVRRALLEDLPQAQLTRSVNGDFQVISVRWHAGGRVHHRELFVLGKKR